MLLLVGANNAQGAFVCQGNFHKPLCDGGTPAILGLSSVLLPFGWVPGLRLQIGD